MMTATIFPAPNPEVLAASSSDNLDEVVAVVGSSTGRTDVVVSSSREAEVVVLRRVPERAPAPALVTVVVAFRRNDRAVEVDVDARRAAVVEVLLTEASLAVVVVLSRVVVPRIVVDVALASGFEVVDDDGTEPGGRLTTWAGAGAVDTAVKTTAVATVTTARCARRDAGVPGGWGDSAGSRLRMRRHRRAPARRCPPTSSIVGARPRGPTPGGGGTTTSCAPRLSGVPGGHRREDSGPRARDWPGGAWSASRLRR